MTLLGRRRLCATGLALSVGLALLVLPGGRPPAAHALAVPVARTSPPAYHPSRLAHLGAARQVVVVTAPHWSSSRATLRGYRLDAAGRWRLRYGPWRARLGWNGLVRAGERRQSTGTTPAGTFDLGPGFGSRPDPGTGLVDYRRFDSNDYWVYDPRDASTYNVLQPFRSPHAKWRRTWAERLMHWGSREYRYGVVIGFNLPGEVRWSKRRREYVAVEPADTRRGGGIFLHVNGRGPTAGCVSVSAARMRRLLRWLDDPHSPRIVIGPLSAIDRM